MSISVAQFPHMYQCVFNPFQPSVALHIQTSHLICRAKQMTGFYMRGHTAVKWVKFVPNGKSAYNLKP